MALPHTRRCTATHPVISNFHNIVEADALLTWKKKVPLLDKQGNAVTQWDVSLQRNIPRPGKTFR